MHTYFFAKKWSYVWIFSDAKVATKTLIICSLVSCPVFDLLYAKKRSSPCKRNFVILFILSKLDNGTTWVCIYIINFVYTHSLFLCVCLYSVTYFSILLSVPDPHLEAEETLFHFALFLYTCECI